VVEHDERLTTVIAERSLRAGGADRAARKRLRDAVAAQVMLQGYLDVHK
jgi:RNase H-fold protein (predicted Holliday junction resolvase)